MAETERSLADDREVIGHVTGCETKSPWKTSASPAETVVDAPVMGAHSWPALSDAQQPRPKNPPSAAAAPSSKEIPTSIPNPPQVSQCYDIHWIIMYLSFIGVLNLIELGFIEFDGCDVCTWVIKFTTLALILKSFLFDLFRL